MEVYTLGMVFQSDSADSAQGDAQKSVQISARERYVLYQYLSCPFCARVRRFIDAQGIDLPMRDTMQDVAAFRELLMGGGRATVPCLRIEQDDEASSSSASRKHVRWLYESAAIIDYLAERRVASDKS